MITSPVFYNVTDELPCGTCGEVIEMRPCFELGMPTTCDVCGARLVLDKDEAGWFWSCQ